MAMVEAKRAPFYNPVQPVQPKNLIVAGIAAVNAVNMKIGAPQLDVDADTVTKLVGMLVECTKYELNLAKRAAIEKDPEAIKEIQTRLATVKVRKVALEKSLQVYGVKKSKFNELQTDYETLMKRKKQEAEQNEVKKPANDAFLGSLSTKKKLTQEEKEDLLEAAEAVGSVAEAALGVAGVSLAAISLPLSIGVTVVLAALKFRKLFQRHKQRQSGKRLDNDPAYKQEVETKMAKVQSIQQKLESKMPEFIEFYLKNNKNVESLKYAVAKFIQGELASEGLEASVDVNSSTAEIESAAASQKNVNNPEREKENKKEANKLKEIEGGMAQW